VSTKQKGLPSAVMPHSIVEPHLSLATLASFPRALVVKEVAALLGCSDRHVYTINARGGLPNIKGMGAALRFAPAAVFVFINGTPAEVVTI
jgi:predicted DNA-binding transcriptional regulator AlpA